MKKFLLKTYYFGNLSKNKIEENKEKIRQVEWDALKKHIPRKSKFLDVGCGTGYAMRKATDELACVSFGVDPEPGAHGVGRYSDNSTLGLSIKKGFAEKIDYDDETFDVVYCSHVLEHVNDEQKSLNEMKRVLKKGGTLIIGMPTSNMAWVNFYTDFLFTTHHRVFNVVFQIFPFIKTGKTPLINMIIPHSHSAHIAKTIFFDLRHYKVDNWKSIVSKVFKIEKILLPAFYPYPQYRQLFSMKKNYKKSSSVFFICKK